MAENTVSDQVWQKIMSGRGPVISFNPNEAGKFFEEFHNEMTRLGYCSYCEGKLDDDNHKDGKCKFKAMDESEVA